MENKRIYHQPFNSKEFGSERNRIPALFTLNDGSVMVGADMRYGHGQDSPNNIDIAVAVSKDGYTDWEYTMINHFDDFADTVTEKESASFIDSTIVQSKTGRIFMLADADPAGCGTFSQKQAQATLKLTAKSAFFLQQASTATN